MHYIIDKTIEFRHRFYYRRPFSFGDFGGRHQTSKPWLCQNKTSPKITLTIILFKKYNLLSKITLFIYLWRQEISLAVGCETTKSKIHQVQERLTDANFCTRKIKTYTVVALYLQDIPLYPLMYTLC